MLASKNRFHGHGSLRFVYAKGRVARSRYFVCKTTDNQRRSQPRVSVVVSKKVMKSAVKRNRIRRRLYEAIRAQLPRLKQQADIVFIVVSPELLTATHEDITTALTSSLSQADLYSSPKN